MRSSRFRSRYFLFFGIAAFAIDGLGKTWDFCSFTKGTKKNNIESSGNEVTSTIASKNKSLSLTMKLMCHLDHLSKSINVSPNNWLCKSIKCVSQLFPSRHLSLSSKVSHHPQRLSIVMKLLRLLSFDSQLDNKICCSPGSSKFPRNARQGRGCSQGGWI